MKKSETAAKTEPISCPIEKWRRLYSVAARLKELQPWSILWDADIITIQLPDRETPLFCSVMGRGGDCFGFGIYPGYESFMRLHRLMSAKGPVASGIAMYEQSCLMCYYGDREEIAPQDRAVMQELGLKFRGRNQWIYFRALEPGYLPWFLSEEQVDLLAEALENLTMACLPLLRGELHVDFEGGKSLIRFYSDERGEWLNTSIELPPIPVGLNSLCIGDELLLARVKQSKKTGETLELDSFYIPAPLQEKKGEVPYLPRMTLLADRKEGMLIGQHLSQPGESWEKASLAMLVNWIDKQGRPAALYVRDEYMANLLKEACGQVGVTLRFGKGMPAVDGFYEEILNFRG